MHAYGTATPGVTYGNRNRNNVKFQQNDARLHTNERDDDLPASIVSNKFSGCMEMCTAKSIEFGLDMASFFHYYLFIELAACTSYHRRIFRIHSAMTLNMCMPDLVPLPRITNLSKIIAFHLIISQLSMANINYKIHSEQSPDRIQCFATFCGPNSLHHSVIIWLTIISIWNIEFDVTIAPFWCILQAPIKMPNRICLRATRSMWIHVSFCFFFFSLLIWAVYVRQCMFAKTVRYWVRLLTAISVFKGLAIQLS